MEISERYDVNCNSYGNIRWHVRDINGKKFSFEQEFEQGYITISVHAWVTDVDMEIYDFDNWDGASTPPTKLIKYTGFSPYPLHRFSGNA